MAMFWEFFTFELKFRFKSISTYIYFLLWFTFNFLDVASDVLLLQLHRGLLRQRT